MRDIFPVEREGVVVDEWMKAPALIKTANLGGLVNYFFVNPSLSATMAFALHTLIQITSFLLTIFTRLMSFTIPSSSEAIRVVLSVYRRLEILFPPVKIRPV